MNRDEITRKTSELSTIAHTTADSLSLIHI